jgi:hypothetical protein
VLTIVFAGLCGTRGAWEGFTLAGFAELRAAQAPVRQAPDPVLAEQVWSAKLAAQEQMREPRMVVLFALALACSLTFVASVRFLRPAGLVREHVRRILVWALVVAAVLRTIDGAQAAAVARRAADGLRLPPGIEGTAAEQLRAVAPAALMTEAILTTVLVAGAFIVLSQYFRSPRVRAWVQQADAVAR